jgi:hypothetical protein
VRLKCLPSDSDVVIWAYTVEILSLREGLPEKQSVNRGIATWAVAGSKSRVENIKRRERVKKGGRCVGIIFGCIRAS